MTVQNTIVTATITAHRTWSDPLSARDKFNFSLSGSWTGTVFVQWSFDQGTTWADIDSYTANTAKVGNIGKESQILVRFGVKDGGFGSGSIVGVLSN